MAGLDYLGLIAASFMTDVCSEIFTFVSVFVPTIFLEYFPQLFQARADISDYSLSFDGYLLSDLAAGVVFFVIQSQCHCDMSRQTVVYYAHDKFDFVLLNCFLSGIITIL